MNNEISKLASLISPLCANESKGHNLHRVTHVEDNGGKEVLFCSDNVALMMLYRDPVGEVAPEVFDADGNKVEPTDEIMSLRKYYVTHKDDPNKYGSTHRIDIVTPEQMLAEPAGDNLLAFPTAGISRAKVDYAYFSSKYFRKIAEVLSSLSKEFGTSLISLSIPNGGGNLSGKVELHNGWTAYFMLAAIVGLKSTKLKKDAVVVSF